MRAHADVVHRPDVDAMTVDHHLLARILLVNADRHELRLVERPLSNFGYMNIVSASDPADAVARYRDQPPDLVILDPHMPGLRGLEAMDRLSGIDCQDSIPPVFVLTGITDVATRVAALERGARDFLPQPVDRAELLARVRNLLEPRVLYQTATAERRLAELSAAERDWQLREARLEMMQRLTITAESRDGGTGQHLERVARYATLLGLAAGLDDRQANLLGLAAPLHDVGKMAIPDAILNKPGQLDSQEWAVMRTHTTAGARLLRDSQWPELQLAEHVALTHHERWDGSGYPAGLARAEISLEGRICSLVDAFDALTSSRPYKRAWTFDEAAAEIQRQRGLQFDPNLTDLFEEQLDKFAAIRQELPR